MFGSKPKIEFSEAQQKQLLALLHYTLKESLGLAVIFVFALFLLGDGFYLIFLKVLFVPCFGFSSVGLQLVWPKRADSTPGIWLLGRAMYSAVMSCMFLVFMVRPDRTVGQLAVMFGVMLLLTFLISLFRTNSEDVFG